MNNKEKSRSWFCVLNLSSLYVEDESELYTDDMTDEQKATKKKNMEKLKRIFGDMTPEEIVDTAIERWIQGKPQRTCAVNYEIGQTTQNRHLHLVLCDPAQSRFSNVLSKFPGIHCAETKGNKQQAEDYILKRGRFQEKEHTVIVPAKFYGNIVGKTSGCRGDLTLIQELIEIGKTPRQILDTNIQFRRHENIVRSAFFAYRWESVPVIRKINVIWHLGKAGSGKSYTYKKLADKYGEDEIYFVTDYANNCTGSFDLYCAEKILFLDEFKGVGVAYGLFLSLLSGYKSQIHCRYANAYSLWNEVHITSVLTPEECYEAMVKESLRSRDDIKQLLRRITTIVYHYKNDTNDEYLTYNLPMSEYKGYENLVYQALKNWGLNIKDITKY